MRVADILFVAAIDIVLVGWRVGDDLLIGGRRALRSHLPAVLLILLVASIIWIALLGNRDAERQSRFGAIAITVVVTGVLLRVRQPPSTVTVNRLLLMVAAFFVCLAVVFTLGGY